MRLSRILASFTLILLIPVLVSSAIYAAPGDLDRTFSGDGKLIDRFGVLARADAVAIQPDGKIVVTGYFLSNIGGFVLARYNPDGSPDMTFDLDGKVVTMIGEYCEATSVAIQPDGKIVVAGYAVSGMQFIYDFAVARYNIDGSLDTTFNGTGKVITPVGTYDDEATSVAIQADGRIVVAGTAFALSNSETDDFAVIRYNNDGSLDTTFDSDGIVITPVTEENDQAYSLSIESDGKIVVAGLGGWFMYADDWHYAVVRYNSNGSLDADFDGDGKVITDLPDHGGANSVAVQSDGKIVAAGVAGVVRYNTNGSLDTSFDSDGITTCGHTSISIQSDGKIVASGSIYNGSYGDFALVRCTSDGSLDTTFGGGDGKTTIDFDASNDVANGMALDRTGRAVIVGESDGGFAIARFLLGPRAIADFDGDGRTDISIYRPLDGNWYVLHSSTGSGITNWGASTDIPRPGDFDNDGKTDIAVYRPSTGEWFIMNSFDSSFTVANWGTAGDRPLAGDFDGDGKADISVYRPSDGTWYIARSGGGFDVVQWGTADDLPVPGNYDSDGKSDIAVYRPSTGQWFVLPSSGDGYAVSWGTLGDIPVAADYDGDGKDDIAVYRPSDGNWYILKTATNNSDVISWGVATDIPVPGDYDGDGKADIAQFRPSTGDWFVLRSTSGYDVVNWGIGTDKPVPAAYIP